MRQIQGFEATAMQVLAWQRIITITPQCHPSIPAGANRGQEADMSKEELEMYCDYHCENKALCAKQSMDFQFIHVTL